MPNADMSPVSETPKRPLEQRAVRSALWQLLGGAWQTLVRLGASVFLARALQPEDFGIFGMAILVRSLLLAIGNLGVGSGVIAKKNVTQTDLSTCYWTIAPVRILMFAAGFLGAPIAGLFLGDMNVVPVVRIVSFLFLISLIDDVSLTILVKNLEFGKLNVIRGVGALVESSIAVCLAMFTDLGYWALVYAMLSASAMMSISTFLVAGWRPSLEFSGKSFRYLFHFGANIFGYSVANYLNENIDYLLVGRILGARALGLYEFAYRIPHLVLDRISTPISAVVFPVLAKMQGENKRLLNGYLSVVRNVSIITLPLVLGLAGVADVAVLVLWGEQWSPIVLPMRILAFHAALVCIAQPIRAIFLCKERPELQFIFQGATLVLTAICVGVGGHYFGLNGVAGGMFLGGTLQIISVWFGLRLVDGCLFDLIKAVSPVFACSAACGLGAAIIVRELTSVGWNNVATLLLAILGGGIIYILACFIFLKETIISLVDRIKESILM